MMKILMLLGWLCVATILQAQQIHLSKTTIIGGNRGIDIKEMRSTPDGGVFWTGYTKDSTGSGDYPVCSHRTDSLKMVAGKIDSNGNKEWVKVFCDWNAQASAGCPTADRGFIIGGFKIDTPDLFLTKLDCQGKVQWQKRWGSTGMNGFDKTNKVIQTKDGGYLLVGGTCGDNGDIPFSYRPPNAPFLWNDIVLIKTDSLGNKEWLKIYGSTTSEGSKHIFQVGDYYYIISQHDNLLHDHDFADTSAYPGQSWTYLMKIDSIGNMLWNRSVGEIGPNDAMFDTRDSTFVCVATASINYPPVYKNDSNTFDDFAVAKINMEGQVVWAKHYGSTVYNDFATGICKGPGNTYLVLGQTIETFQHPVPIGSISDGLLYWIDSAGNEIEHKYYGNSDLQVPEKIVPLNSRQFLGADKGDAALSYTEGTWHYGNGVDYGVAFSVWELWPVSVPAVPDNAFKALKIYPNPTDNAFTVELQKPHQEFTIQVYSSEGRKIGTYQGSGQRLKIDTRGWMSGAYIVNCSDSKQIIGSAKIQIQH